MSALKASCPGSLQSRYRPSHGSATEWRSDSDASVIGDTSTRSAAFGRAPPCHFGGCQACQWAYRRPQAGRGPGLAGAGPTHCQCQRQWQAAARPSGMPGTASVSAANASGAAGPGVTVTAARQGTCEL
jgi:hypothetical protein